MGWYPCCCLSCEVASDNFDRETIGDDWTEVSGSWEILFDMINGGLLYSNGAAGLIVHDYTGTEANVIVDAMVNSCASVRVIADYVDANNYAYAEHNATAGELRVGRRAGGTDTDIDTVAFTCSFSVRLRLCISGTTITALAMNSEGGIHAVASGTTTAATAGRKTGLVQLTSTAAYFDWFKISTPDADEERDDCRCPTSEPDDCCCGQWWDPVADATVDLTELDITNGDWCDNCGAIAAVWDLPYAGPSFPCQWSVLEDWCDFDADAFRLENPGVFTCTGTGPWVLGISLTYESSGSDCIITVTLNMAPTDVFCPTEPDTFPSWTAVYRKTFTPDGDCGGEHTLDRVSAETLDHYSCGITFPATIPVTIPEPNAPVP